MPAVDDTPATARWRQLVTGRIGEMQRLSPGAGSLAGSFWDGRAERYAAESRLADARADPLLRRLRGLCDGSSTVIDAGAGAGRHALALAAHVGHVTAVEPSAPMLAVLRRHAAEAGIANVTTSESTWEQADAGTADVAYSAYVLTLVPDAAPFVTKLDAAARRHVVLYLGAYSADALLDPLWRHFHGMPRAPGPSYLDAIAVLRELGIEPRITIVDVANTRRFATIADAVEHYRDALLLDDATAMRRELEELLPTWLQGRRGAFRSPLRSMPVAILAWRPLAAR